MSERRITNEVLAERLTNLITRVTAGFLDQQQEVLKNRAETLGVKEEVREQNHAVLDMKATIANHLAEDRIVHQEVVEHLKGHQVTDAEAKGRSEAFSLLDKVLLRGISIGSLIFAAVKAYESFAK